MDNSYEYDNATVKMISTRVKTKMVDRAKLAKARLARKKQFEEDSDCMNNQKDLYYDKEYDIISFKDFLENFADEDNPTLDAKKTVGKKIKLKLRNVPLKAYAMFNDISIENELDRRWLTRMNKYISSLSVPELFTLYGYTHIGDQFVNNYIRGTFKLEDFENYLKQFPDTVEPDEDDEQNQNYHFFPLFFPMLKVIRRTISNEFIIDNDKVRNNPDKKKHLSIFLQAIKDNKYSNSTIYDTFIESGDMMYLSYNTFWISVLEQLRDDIETIISNAPSMVNPCILYRGVKDDYFLTKYMLDNSDRIHVTNSFVSTSSAVDAAIDFYSIKNQCCFIRIYVPANMKLLLLAGLKYEGEAEFLMGYRTQFFIKNTRIERLCSVKKKEPSKRIQMRVADVVMIH